MSERDAIYANPDASEETICMRESGSGVCGVRRLHRRSACRRAVEWCGYSAGVAQWADAGSRAGFKLRVLLAQALFSDPENSAAGRAYQQPRYQHHPLARGHTQRAQQHHGDHLA